MIKKYQPNFIIIGAMKSATTSLYTYLKQHPEIFMPNIKEPMFFSGLDKKNDRNIVDKTSKIITFKQYYTLFTNVSTEKAIGEASPSYIFNKNCAELIYKYLPNTKIIAILRQPTHRAYSNYLHAKRSGREPMNDFVTAFKAEEIRKTEKWSPLYYYKDKGFYFKQLSRYYKIFPKENIKILLFEDLIKDPEKSSKEVFEFLKVDTNFIPKTIRKANKSGVPKGILGWILMKLRYYNLVPKNIQFSKFFPRFIMKLIYASVYKNPEKLNITIVKNLTQEYYKKDILQLEKLIKKDLQHWLN